MTINPKLKKELFELLEYNPDSGKFYWLKDMVTGNGLEIRLGDLAGHCSNRYLAVSISGVEYLLHRIAFVFMTDDWPKYDVDHINRNPRDNRWCNLRDTDETQNAYNSKTRSDNTSGRKGVAFFPRTGKWMAYIIYKGKQNHLGYFAKFEDAVAAREKAERYYFECK